MTEPEFSAAAFIAACSDLDKAYDAGASVVACEAVRDIQRLIQTGTISRQEALDALTLVAAEGADPVDVHRARILIEHLYRTQ